MNTDSDNVIPAEAGIQALSATESTANTEPMEPRMNADDRGLGPKS